MSQQSQPATKPTAVKNVTSTTTERITNDPKKDFFLAATNMSWQLALVVLVPLIGGFKLDQHLHSAPLWTISGFVVAIVGMAVVVWRQLQIFSPTTTSVKKEVK